MGGRLAVSAEVIDGIAARFDVLTPVLDERMCRLLAGAEALAIGKGGVAAVRHATGIFAKRVIAGKKELKELARKPPAESPSDQRIRRPGAGRKPLTEKDPTLLRDLESLVEPVTRGDPESPLRWTCKSVRKLAEELVAMGHEIGPQKVSELLAELGYSLQSNRKTKEGSSHPDRNAQFEHINAEVEKFQERGSPVISVDTKKKELVGDFKNGGREWRPSGEPEDVRVHDFIDKKLGKAIPYGIYDVSKNQGWVSVGVDHDTADFAVESIRRWWRRMGRRAYPEATELLITADGGGSNSPRVHLWKIALQELVDETGLTITVLHYPPGTSKWNKIEHRMFSHITQNWRGQPLESVETVVNLIGSTRTTKGLFIRAALDSNRYETEKEATAEEIASLKLTRAKFHGDWNYSLAPRPA
jgi:transposase